MIAFQLVAGLAGLALGVVAYRIGREAWRPLAWPRAVASLAVAGLAVGLVIQLVPYGRDHSNPPITGEPTWDSAQTRDLADRACFDCHSNEVEWPWYSNIAPVSWLVQSDVEGARHILNFSEFDRPQRVREAVETVREGSMPPFQYLIAHPNARLSAEEKDQLAAGLAATLGQVRQD
ncbi:MAG: heme-binding domain-containing protein [Dehalococcoidia bacterium]